jgi:hypothetical protein
LKIPRGRQEGIVKHKIGESGEKHASGGNKQQHERMRKPIG